MWLQRIADWIKKHKIQVPYSMRVSPKAKYLQMRIVEGKGLEVVLPRGCSSSKAISFLRSRYDWVLKHRRDIEIAAQQVPQKACLPDEIILPAINQCFYVSYQASPSENPSLHMPTSNQIKLHADPDSQLDACCELLQTWLKNRAKDELVPYAYSLANEYNLPIARVQIRRQKTRWGSMSTSGTLSLNCQLMFLAQELMRHVLVHELCHVLHRNHGPEFKSMLSRLSPNRVKYEQELKHVRQDTIPLWAKL